jgi:hypothetical protein
MVAGDSANGLPSFSLALGSATTCKSFLHKKKKKTTSFLDDVSNALSRFTIRSCWYIQRLAYRERLIWLAAGKHDTSLVKNFRYKNV